MSTLKSIHQVIAEVAAHHPHLIESNALEQDRAWLWLCGDFSSEQHADLRKSLGREGIGFRFAPKGHKLPSGRVAHWAHHCDRPTKFKGKGGGKGNAPANSQKSVQTNTPEIAEISTDELLALI